MRAVREEATRLHDEARELARWSCEHGDIFRRRRIAPSDLNTLQRAVRKSLLFVEERMATLARRKEYRAGRVKRRFGAAPGFGRALGEHIKALQYRDAELELQRNLLRQAGDSLAWLALDRQPDVIAPLYAPAPHRLPRQIGIVGVAIIAGEAHRTGKWLAVEADLTRCLGVGDLVIVPFGRRWHRPLVLEVKTKGEYRPEGVADITVHSVVREGGADATLLDEFNASLGLKPSVGAPLAQTHGPQAERLLEHVQALHAITGLTARRLNVPNDGQWSRLTDVIGRAMDGGSAMSIGEDGVAYVAIRHREGDDVEAAVQAMLDQLRASGFERGQAEYLSSFDFQNEGAGEEAGVVPPIALWDVPATHRVSLLLREVDLSIVIRPGVWREAFAEMGIEFSEHQGAWIVALDGKRAILSAFVAAKLHNALLIGVSPREVANSVMAALRRKPGG